MSEVKHTITTEFKNIQVEYLETPVTSENDLMKYRVFKLPNGLTVLLISNKQKEDEENEDEDTSDEEDSPSVKRIKRNQWTAECGLCVGVGSFSDPLEVPGIARFLEHMICMGSEKYPQENDFNEFISNHGGCKNSITEYEHTTFYFSLGGIHKTYLLSALDRFAQFFIKPLIKKDIIMREQETIKNEFEMSSTYDFARKYQLLASLARTGHPVNKFSWTNLIRLTDNIMDDDKLDKLYEELHKFRKRHYSAHRMKLVLQATLPLDILEKYVTTCFADVPSNGLPPDDFTKFKDGVPFDSSAFRKMYKVKHFKDISQLHVTWTMPSLLNLYKSKPHNYILWIIKHKGKGSLISYLRKKRWSFDFLSDNIEDDFEHNSMYTLFSLIVVLSYEGLQHLEEVLDAIYSFINLLKKEGPQKRIYEEIYKIAENNFRFLGNNDYTDCLCKNMHLYPPRDYITGNQNYFEYNPEAIQKCLDYLVPETANIMIFNKDFHCLELNKIEPCFNTSYTDIEIPKAWIERWKSIKPLPDFHLPIPDTCLISDFSLISTPEEYRIKYPRKLFNGPLLEIWYHPKFSWPKCYINFHFIFPLGLIESPKNVAFLEIYCNTLKQLLREEVYPLAALAEFDYDINISKKGIIIQTNGFNEKLPALLMDIVKLMLDYPVIIVENLFKIIKLQQLEKYYNKLIEAEKFIKNVKLWILNEDVHYTHIDIHAALRDINFEEFREFVGSFINSLYIQCLVQGNVSQDTAIGIRQCFEILECVPLSFGTIPHMRTTQIPLGTSYCKLKNINKFDTKSIVTNYYQVGIVSTELSVLIDLIIMIMQELLFNQLCIQEQLSNRVSCVSTDVNGILGFSITVHIKDNYTTEHVDQRIEEFLKLFNKILDEFPEEKLNIFKEALRLKQCIGVGFLKNEVDRNWSEIMNRQYMFDRFEKKILAIKNIKINELREWFVKHIRNGSNFRKLSLHVVGTVDPKKSEVERADNTAIDYNEARDFVLEYIIDDKQRKETEGHHHHIMNIENYKKDLFIYPCVEKLINLVL